MVLMSEGFGGDPRLVAYMQFMRVMMGAVAGAGSKIPAGPLLVPLFAGALLHARHLDYSAALAVGRLLRAGRLVNRP